MGLVRRAHFPDSPAHTQISEVWLWFGHGRGPENTFLKAQNGPLADIWKACPSLGCKRSRVQISAARPNSSNTYGRQSAPMTRSGVQVESKKDVGWTPWRAFRNL